MQTDRLIEFNKYLDSLMLSRERVSTILGISVRTLYRYSSGNSVIPEAIFLLVKTLAMNHQLRADELLKSRLQSRIASNTVSLINAKKESEEKIEN